MDIAKSLFSSRTHEGYSGKQNYNQNVETAISEDEEGEDKSKEVKLDMNKNTEKDTISDLSPSITPCPGGPFSALTPSMWPQDIIAKLNQVPEDPNSQPDYRFDEFGFRVEEEDGPEQNSNKLLSEPFIEDPQHRLQWVAYLEFNTPDKEETETLTWDNLGTISRTDKMRSMTRKGIPHSLRPQLWLRLSGALEKKALSKIKYQDIVKASSSDALAFAKQIEKDLLRTMPTNACFSTFTSTGVPRLRRILRALAWLFPDIGYCQGTGMIAASLLLLMEEEEAFWTLSAIVEDLLPASYYTPTLIGIQADQKVLRSLVASSLPDLESTLIQHDIELSLITLHWFLTLFASVIHFKILLRIWDLFFLDGSIVLFQITLGMLKIKEPVLVTLENSAQIFNALSDIPGDIVDVDHLLEVSFSVSSSISQSMVDSHRRRHLAFLMSDQGTLIGNPEGDSNLPKQHLNRRQVKRQKSILQNLIFGEEENGDDVKTKNIHQTGETSIMFIQGDPKVMVKTKNIHQTEILVDLREATCQIGRHFLTTDPRLSHASLTPNYSPESHQGDHDAYADVSRTRQRRAKALLDFERHDDDELGFRKNDVITIISQKDEHCWIGELNGLKGWFPAKFVELLDERSKQYSLAGDDSVTETITDLVRGTLCPALKQILSIGLKRRALGEVCHPWLFIEEVATREVEKDFSSVYSRLLLCKTYRLDEDGKVLTPEELLYRCVQAVNLSHDNVHVQMDVKLRSLICLGLNEQVLHLWLEVLCSCEPVVHKWYHPWSFISSPGWVQIKCDLRVLSQFPFNLSPDWELPPRKGQSQPLKDGVQDMLVKHHLFSWDL
uniref:RUN and TBC1 domain-containing protein 3 n=1 Tax=Cacopsylla melanoneura TaxID=428564 RepID=A0A8D8RWV6_9HEMI